MLSQMRANTKTIMLILVAAFVATIVFSWGMDLGGGRSGASAQSAVGSINGRDISYEFFFRLLQNEYVRIRELTGNEPDNNRMRQARDQVWQQLIDETLIQEEVERHNITVTDDEIIFILRNNPPDFLRQQPAFQTDGLFDPAKYQTALNNPDVSWVNIENHLRETFPQTKMQSLILSTIRLTNAEVRRAYLSQSETVTVNYVFSGPNDFSDEPVDLTDDQIGAYYRDHQDAFLDPPTRTLRYTVFSTAMTAADSQAVYQQIDELKERLDAGDDIGELARLYSADPSVDNNGGDLGTFARGNMVAEFEEAAFAAKAGDVIGPVESQFGFHIIKVHALLQGPGGAIDSVHASHILIEMAVSEAHLDDIRYDARYFSETARDEGFEAAAEAESLGVIETPPIQEGGFVAGLGYVPDLSSFAFGNDAGSISQALDCNAGIAVFEIIGQTDERQIPLEEVSATVRSILERGVRKDKARAFLENISQAHTAGQNLVALTADQDLIVTETPPLRIGDFVPAVGREPQFTGLAFKLSPGEIGGPVETTNGYYLLELTSRSTPDSVAERSQDLALRRNLLLRKQQIVYSAWLQQMRDNADIEDNREKFFN